MKDKMPVGVWQAGASPGVPVAWRPPVAPLGSGRRVGQKRCRPRTAPLEPEGAASPRADG